MSGYGATSSPKATSDSPGLLPLPAEADSPARNQRSTKLIRLAAVALGLAVGGFLYLRHPVGAAPPAPSPPEWDDSAAFTDFGRGEIAWAQCPASLAKQFECGRLQAPLDYTSNGDPRNASVAVVRYRAGGGKTNRAAVLGSLLLNPGGPGGSGIGFATNRKPQNANRTTAEVFDTLFEGRYDIVSFDPRGVGRTWPGVQCFDRPDALAINEFQSLANGVLGSHTDHATKAEFGTDLAQLSLFSSVCAANATREEQMRYVSTPFVARDMKLLYEALGDTALHYWGFSYGTVLGSVFADMFPQHVGRVAIDGVVDVPAYHEGAWSNNLLDTEDEFRLLFEECVSAGPEACPLAKIVPQGTKASDLHTEVSNWLAQLKSHPIPALQVQPPQLLTFGSVVGQIFTSLYAPAQWPGLVQRLAEAIEGNVTALAEAVAVTLKLEDKVAIGADGAPHSAIACGDVLDPPGKDWSIAEYRTHLDSLLSDSPTFGYLWAGMAPKCLGAWRLRAKERHFGHFDSPTAFPLLSLGNDYDPVTPGRFADLMASKFPGAVSVRREGYGHCTISQPSTCIDEILKNYFIHGKLPAQDTYCKVNADHQVFPAPGAKAKAVPHWSEGVAESLHDTLRRIL